MSRYVFDPSRADYISIVRADVDVVNMQSTDFKTFILPAVFRPSVSPTTSPITNRWDSCGGERLPNVNAHELSS